MSKKKNKKNKAGGMVYSTDPDFDLSFEEEEITNLAPSDQNLIIRKDKKQRKGKLVTLVEGFEGPDLELKLLAKSLKALCGTGGSAKDGEIIIQGDFLEKIYTELIKMGFRVKKLG